MKFTWHKTNKNYYLQGILPFAVLMVGGYLLYSQVFSGIWLMDDYIVLVNNPDIRSFNNFLEDFYPGRPLRELTYLLDYSLFGLEPAGYYLQQIFWHGLCSWLVFLLAKRLSFSKAVSWGTALVFLTHPIHVEVVANISHRKDSLALAFCLLSALLYLFGRERASGSCRTACYVLSALSWGIALTAKQNALALPLVVISYELFRAPSSYRCKVITGAFSLAIVGLGARLVYMLNSERFIKEIKPALLKIDTVLGGTPEMYFMTVFKAWAFMFSKLVYPVDLSMEYTFSVPEQWNDPWVLCGMLIPVVVIGLFFCFSRSALLPYFSLVWFVAFWLPTSNLLGHFSYFAADRYWYTPSVSLFLLVSYVLWKWNGPHPRRFFVLVFVSVFMLGWQTWQQQKVWLDEDVFYQHMLKVNPLALQGFVGMAQAAIKENDLETANRYLQKAFQRGPSDGRVLQKLGYVAYKQGQFELAENYFQMALLAKPQFIDTYNNLGILYDDLGQTELAIETFEKGLKFDPHCAEIYTNLGVVYEGLGQLKKAEAVHRRAIFERPDYPRAHFNLGNTLYHSGRKQDAMQSYQTVIQLVPENVDALYNYALVANELNRNDLVPPIIQTLKRINPALAIELEEELK